MALPDEARERLADVVELQPTKNAELADRWGMDEGSDVHAYLESTLSDYYYRDDDSLIRATPDAVELITGEPPSADDARTVSALQAAVLDVLGEPEDDPRSVVATLHALRETGRDPAVDDVRSALHGLVDMGFAERVQRTVPTFRLARPRAELAVQVAKPV